MTAQLIQPDPPLFQRQVVVFSKNYLPLAHITLKRAIALLVTGRAESLELGNPQRWEVRSPSLVLQVSEHIRLLKGNPKRPWKVPPVSRREVFRRDQHPCQYCNSTRQLTLDHVIPRSKGGTHTWDNVVTACSPCNSAKGDRPLPVTGMVLKTKPKAPMHPAFAFAEQFWQTQNPAQ